MLFNVSGVNPRTHKGSTYLRFIMNHNICREIWCTIDCINYKGRKNVRNWVFFRFLWANYCSHYCYLCNL